MAWEPGQPIPRYHYRFHKPVIGAEGRQVHYVELVELPNCSAQGDSPGDAFQRLWQAVPDYLNQLHRLRLPIPDPNPPGNVEIGSASMIVASFSAAPQQIVVSGNTMRRVIRGLQGRPEATIERRDE